MSKVKPSLSRLIHFHDDERGQVLVIGAFIVLSLAMISIAVANVGMMAAEKIHIQDTADATAYSAAVVEARYMNLNAYINRAMLANYNSMAWNTGLWATIASHDHGSAIVTAMLYGVVVVVEAASLGIATSVAMNLDQVADALRDYLHHPMHVLNQELRDWFSQDESDLNQYFEIMNVNLLSMYQGLLFAAAQSARHDIIKQVAAKMDSEVVSTTVLGLGAETVSYDELNRAVDYVIADPDDRDGIFSTLSARFNDMAGEDADRNDHPYLLGAVGEASLDKFAAGRKRDGEIDLLRQFNVGDIISDIVRPVEIGLEIACEAATLTFGDCDYDIRLDLGGVVREGQEDKANQVHVPFLANQRMREVNGWVFGLHIDGFGAFILNWALGQNGYTAGDRRNDVADSANVTISLEYGIPDLERSFQSILAGSFTTNPIDVPSRGLNSINMRIAGLMAVTLPIFCDDHWDGYFDPEPVNYFEIFPPGLGIAEGVQYLAAVIANPGTDPGIPNYDWQVDLEDVGFSHYHYDFEVGQERATGNSRGDTDNLLTGPSIAAVVVKKASDVNGLHGLRIGNTYDIRAISRAQVYYLKNPNRPDERPSLFNPHWGARLAPLDSDETPTLLREGLPYVASMGLPVTPTH